MNPLSTHCRVRIVGPLNADLGQPLRGFRFFWTTYVRGFDPTKHCRPCLLGKKSARLTLRAYRVGNEVTLDETDRFDFIYICGVATTGYLDNFHLALRPHRLAETDPFHAITSNGYALDVTGASQVEIPELPDDWHGLGKEFTGCRNFRFGAAVYGFQPPGTQTVSLVALPEQRSVSRGEARANDPVGER